MACRNRAGGGGLRPLLGGALLVGDAATCPRSCETTDEVETAGAAAMAATLLEGVVAAAVVVVDVEVDAVDVDVAVVEVDVVAAAMVSTVDVVSTPRASEVTL